MEHFPVPEYAKGDPDANHSNILITSAIIMACFSTTAVGLRFTSRLLTRVSLMADDWLILAALPFSLMLCSIDIYGPRNGFGRHLQYSTPETLRRFFQATFTFELAYNFAIVLPKFSMLCLYWRLFGLDSIKWPLLATGSLTVLFFIACTFTATFACSPISDYWNNPGGGHCINHALYYIGQAVANIVIDVILMLLPIIPIQRLNMRLSHKGAVCGIFFLGIFVTLCSGLRLDKLVTTQHITAIDPTFALVDAAMWSVIETNLSVVCVCLPSMRPLLRVLLHGRVKSTTGNSSRPSVNRRSTYDSTVAANTKRRSQRANTDIKGITKEQHTTITAAAGTGGDLELGYYATITANPGGRHIRNMGSEVEEDWRPEETSRINTRERIWKHAEAGPYSETSWIRESSNENISDHGQWQQPSDWPLEISKSGQ